jgi:hydroxymethylpyrimidine pyrophosphatase-like HAD family hydrolase
MAAAGAPTALVVTDLDGTLLNAAHRIGPADHEALLALHERGVCRVAATGRNLYSLRRVLAPEDPFDYVVFSSGVGILDWPAQACIRATAIPAPQVRRCVEALVAAGASFMVHDPVPDNHRFAYHEAAPSATDFRRRCALYEAYCREWQPGETFAAGASQLVVIMPPDLKRFERLAQAAAGLSVVRTTSPLDGVSLWMEVFAPGTNKSGAVAFLAARLGSGAEMTYALGNDFNDADLLDWAGHACVTANAPAELRARFPVVRSHDDAGFAHAIAHWGLLPDC